MDLSCSCISQLKLLSLWASKGNFAMVCRPCLSPEENSFCNRLASSVGSPVADQGASFHSELYNLICTAQLPYCSPIESVKVCIHACRSYTSRVLDRNLQRISTVLVAAMSTHAFNRAQYGDSSSPSSLKRHSSVYRIADVSR